MKLNLNDLQAADKVERESKQAREFWDFAITRYNRHMNRSPAGPFEVALKKFKDTPYIKKIIAAIVTARLENS